jgi:transcriptional regulator of nitric oxide reductase
VSCASAVSRVLGALVLILMFAGFQSSQAKAESRLPEFLKALKLEDIFPGATRLGPVEGNPPAAPAYAGDRLLGYVYLNADAANSTGYSGKPINVVVGIDLSGKIVGLKLAEHHEPIVLIGIPEAKITGFLKGYIGLNFLETPPAPNAPPPVDIISGATVGDWRQYHSIGDPDRPLQGTWHRAGGAGTRSPGGHQENQRRLQHPRGLERPPGRRFGSQAFAYRGRDQ